MAISIPEMSNIGHL